MSTYEAVKAVVNNKLIGIKYTKRRHSLNLEVGRVLMTRVIIGQARMPVRVRGWLCYSFVVQILRIKEFGKTQKYLKTHYSNEIQSK